LSPPFSDFCNNIGTNATFCHVRHAAAFAA
jgi:hypothetical protein